MKRITVRRKSRGRVETASGGCMERLSEKAIEIINELHTEKLDYNSEYLPLIEAANHLAAYEDTGLDPEEFHKAFTEATLLKLTAQYLGTSPERLRELVKADQASHLVVLPCKVGDTIWRIKCLGEWPDIGKPYVEADAFLYRDVHYFGKTVFLTREEAEAALRSAEGST